MRPSRTRPAHPLTAVVVASALALAACTGGDPSPGPDAAPTPTVEAGPRPDDVVATATIVDDTVELAVDVHPFVRVDDLVVLSLDVTPTVPSDDRIQVGRFGKLGDGLNAMSNVRALDLERDLAYHPAEDADGEPVVLPERWPFLPPEGGRVQVAYAAPEADALALFLPGAPLLVDVPVVDGEVPEAVLPSPGTPVAATSDGTATPSGTAGPDDAPTAPTLDLAAVASAGVHPLESSSTELDGAVRTVESTQEVQLALDGDVLFEFDQATLTADATTVLELAAARIGEREPGTVQVVGHTDDQGDDAYNRDLSLRRARAVADALAGLVDPARYPTDVEGRGESEPFVANDSEENRALNRRVTLTLASTVVTRTDLTTTGELPPFERGVVAEAGAPVRVVSGLRPWDVEASARRAAGHVVVDLRVTARDDATHLTSVSFLKSLFGHRGEGARSPLSTSNSATVLSGATRLYALDYRLDHETPERGLWLPVADLWGSAWLDDGQSTVFSYVFPPLDGDTVTLQFGSGRGEDDLRIVDIPVAG